MVAERRRNANTQQTKKTISHSSHSVALRGLQYLPSSVAIRAWGRGLHFESKTFVSSLAELLFNRGATESDIQFSNLVVPLYRFLGTSEFVYYIIPGKFFSEVGRCWVRYMKTSYSKQRRASEKVGALPHLRYNPLLPLERIRDTSAAKVASKSVSSWQ